MAFQNRLNDLRLRPDDTSQVFHPAGNMDKITFIGISELSVHIMFKDESGIRITNAKDFVDGLKIVHLDPPPTDNL